MTNMHSAHPFRSWKSGSRRPALAASFEEPSPVLDVAVNASCSNGVIVGDFSDIPNNSYAYKKYLKDVNIPRKHVLYSFFDMNATAVAFLLISSIFIGYWANNKYENCDTAFNNECTKVTIESKIEQSGIAKDQNDIQRINERGYSQSNPERVISQQQNLLKSRFVDIGVFLSIVGALIAFLYTNFQWRMSNRQSSINEFFERKKEINVLLIDREDVRPFLKEAIDRASLANIKKYKINKEDSAKIVNYIQSIDYLGDIPKFTFTQKMFVFMEMDNLEFAVEKYLNGYLDFSQMYRACEIFQSRCLNRGFRYLSVTQGLVYYKDDFKKILSSLIVRGHEYERMSQETSQTVPVGAVG